MGNDSKAKPLYSIIYDHLRDEILRQHYAPGARLPTEVELAKDFGVSRITSKRAMEELERDGYIYRQRGRGSFVRELHTVLPPDFALPRGRSAGRAVPIVLPSEGHGMFGYVQGAAEILNRAGYFLSIQTTNGTAPAERVLLCQLLTSDAKIILYYPIDDRNLDILLALHFSKHSIITIDKRLDGLPTTSVVSDNVGGGRMVTDTLLSRGHRRIAFVSSVELEAVSSVRERFIGYCSALQKKDIRVDPDIVVLDFIGTDDSRSRWVDPRNLLGRLIAGGVTAIQAEHDLIARDLLRYATELGIEVPRDLSIVGFDNTDASQHLSVPLTTVEQNFHEIGRRAAEVAVRFLETNIEPPTQSIVIPVRMIDRSSVAQMTNAKSQV